MTNEDSEIFKIVAEQAALIHQAADTIARLERQLAEAKPKAEALDALGTWSARRNGSRTMILFDFRTAWGVWLMDRNGTKDGTGTDLAAAIMDAVRKAQ